MVVRSANARAKDQHSRRGSTASVAGAREGRHQQRDVIATVGVRDFEIERGALEEGGGPLLLIVRAHFKRKAIHARRKRATCQVADATVCVRFADPLRYVLL